MRHNMSVSVSLFKKIEQNAHPGILHEKTIVLQA